MTNGDKIRSMTDEELAEWFAPCMLCKMCDNYAIGCNMDDCRTYALIYMQRDCDIKLSGADGGAEG